MMPKTMSAAARDAISYAQKQRWARWRKERGGAVRRRRRPELEPIPIVNPPATNGAIAELSVTLHIKGQTVQLTSEEAASVYDALGMVLHKHGLSAS